MGRSVIRQDPYVLVLKYPGTCDGCGKELKQGDEVFYYPKHRGSKATMLCRANGCSAKGEADMEESRRLEPESLGYDPCGWR